MIAANTETYGQRAQEWILKASLKLSNIVDAEETQGWTADNSHAHVVS